MKLMDIIRSAMEIEARLFDLGGEIDDELSKELEFSDANLREKIDAYGAVLNSIEMRSEHARSKLKEWSEILTSCERAEENLKSRLRLALDLMSASEIHGHEYTVKYQSNPPRVKIIDETVIPGAYLITRQETVIDRKSISEALKEGHAVPGAELERTQRLVVKTQTKKGRPALIEKAKAEAELSAAVVANSNGGVSENGNPAAGSTEAAGATAVQ